MNKQHTPGPWEIYENGNRPGIENFDKEVSIIVFGNHGDYGGVWGNDDKEMWANARLISAAPDLLEALINYKKVMQLFIESLPDGYIVDAITAAFIQDAHGSACAAINKATLHPQSQTP